ncbi:MAG: hypothetical protein D6808_02590 [Candidatus Dadabacteria bacterium]|nr:MAG: hypothetical protein D6808_02590 [Candidatus Dadabacteria bacterium]
MDNGKSKEYKISLFITAIVSSFLLFWFRVYLTDAPIPSVDLPSFNAICRGLRHHILRGEVVYYDPKFYTGMLELHFYSFFPALLTTLLSFLCDFFAGDSVRLASHLVLWFGISFFPVALCLALRPFLTELVEKGEYGSSDKIILEALYGVSLSLFSFWFLNHDRQWYGIGAAAPMHIGLISQMFGWYAVLIYLNSLWMCILGKGSFRMIAVSLAFGIFSHNLTVIFMLFLGVLAFLWYPDRRKPVFYGHLFGIGFSMFWLLPCIALSSTYVAFDIYRPKGDFLELFYRYTVYGLWQSVESWFSGRFLPLSPVEPYLMLLTIALFCFNSVRQSRLLIQFFSFGLLGIVIFNSGYVASSIPLGIHYYRYNGVLFLYFAILFSVVPILAWDILYKVQPAKFILKLPVLCGKMQRF